jgi:hypothetical protein
MPDGWLAMANVRVNRDPGKKLTGVGACLHAPTIRTGVEIRKPQKTCGPFACRP